MDNTSEAIRKKKMRRKRAMLKRTHRRINVTFIIVFVMLLALGVRIFMINYTHGEEYSQAVLNHQTYTSTTIPYMRGNITSSDGTVLAYSEKVYNLILDVKSVTSEDGKYLNNTIDALVKCFNLDRDNIKKVINDNPTSQYQKLLKELTSDEIAEFNELKAQKNSNIYGVWFEESYVRKYPFSTLACDVIGFASNVNGGELGLESQYDDALSGTDGVTYSYVDEDLNAVETTKAAVNGNNIVTTIDYNVQSIIEKYMVAYNKEKPSKNTAIVVMNPKNGEILGMASYPQFDLNNPRNLENVYSAEQLASMSDTDITNALYQLWTNYCVSQSYEPGSIFKTVTATAALETGVVGLNDSFTCSGATVVSDRRIRCHKTTGHGTQDFTHTVYNSCNPAFVEWGRRVGTDNMYLYMGKLGLLAKTGIDLSGEAGTIIHKQENVGAVELATMSFGQSFQITPVQMLRAVSAIVNGGRLVTPHFGLYTSSSDGSVVNEFAYSTQDEAISSQTSETMKKILEGVVSEGGGTKAYIDGYSIGGKTATSQKLPRGSGKYISSFIGFAPADNPQVIAMCLIDEPTGVYYGGTIAAPVVKTLYENILPYIGIERAVQLEKNND